MKKLFISLMLLVSGSALAQTSEVTFWVDGVCGMCEKRIETALINTPGVKFADWDKETSQVTVAFNSKKLSEQKLHEILAGVGHDTQKVRAVDGDYAKLPGCCKYRTLSKH
ncbi:MAG: heavy-metal-associated domain-containing protein [Schleiferiaceae bacterium]|jgi:periplasmic mercuric ion binding protein|nr:heavy-metal-associated domain-containing protein [Schleiferiaceae bacterium]MDP4629216.1 heavy-metal-associated domain-containing protein [Schleiferiaceae bacterium]MDP4743134.1 heavy-metal-associated domain-containing protein [Schleiferiaceae bacterium]MDP4773849.1 heavy-metal-associated domain-containing protein [Schleiferiaceae bacterium]MDP4854949.1 heavy-metal-associated domain-containing protein [Schleiferiaceae bacterium]